MHALTLAAGGETIRTIPVEGQPIEVGSAPTADLFVPDPAIERRHFVVVRRGAQVVVHDVRARGVRLASRELSPGRSLPIGDRHTLTWLGDLPTERTPVVRATEQLPTPDLTDRPLMVVIGRGAEARTIALGPRPANVGTDPGADVRLVDRAVSAFHCRLEPATHGVFLRDLSSRNGTFVDGVRTLLGRIVPGARIRVGRTDLTLAERPASDRGASSDPGALAPHRSGMVAASPAMVRILEQVERIAHQRWPALVLGESGVGKEGIARLLHERSPRTRGPFVAINAGGLPRELVESELFGHEKGAFTGAASAHRGVFEQADGGTLFLDEIGELSLDLQSRLLRVIEHHQIRRVGSEAAIPIDVRLVCATHRNLLERARAGTFRLDLYYRIAQLVIEIPRLSARPEDVLALADRFLLETCRDVGPRRLAPDARDVLLAHGWPGNVRELRSVVRAAAIESCSEVIAGDDLIHVITRLSGIRPGEVDVTTLLSEHRGNLSAAAKAIGLPRTTLRDRLRRSDRPGSR